MQKGELAQLLGLKPRQIDNLVAEGMPRTKEGRAFDYGADAVAFYYQRRLEGGRGERLPAWKIRRRGAPRGRSRGACGA